MTGRWYDTNSANVYLRASGNSMACRAAKIAAAGTTARTPQDTPDKGTPSPIRTGDVYVDTTNNTLLLML